MFVISNNKLIDKLHSYPFLYYLIAHFWRYSMISLKFSESVNTDSIV